MSISRILSWIILIVWFFTVGCGPSHLSEEAAMEAEEAAAQEAGETEQDDGEADDQGGSQGDEDYSQ